MGFGADVIWGGFFDPSLGVLNNNICIKNNGSASFVNLRADTNFMLLNTNAEPHNCTQDPLPEVKVNARK